MYFKLPKITDTQFVNKKCVERKDHFESKQKFVIIPATEWKNSTEASQEQFLDAPRRKSNMSINTFPLFPVPQNHQS